jgi:hypothetical protein
VNSLSLQISDEARDFILRALRVGRNEAPLRLVGRLPVLIAVLASDTYRTFLTIGWEDAAEIRGGYYREIDILGEKIYTSEQTVKLLKGNLVVESEPYFTQDHPIDVLRTKGDEKL